MAHNSGSRKTRTRVLLPILSCLLAWSGVSLAYGESNASSYPSRPVTLIVPYGPGGSANLLARAFAQVASRVLGQEIVILNKPGGSGTLGVADVVRARPDGYTIGMSTNAISEFQPLISKLPFSSTDDYRPLAKLADQPAVLSVAADSSWKTLGEFLAEAKKRPGILTVSTAGRLGVADLAMNWLIRRAGVKIITVPFAQGGGQALIALMGKHVDGNVDFPGTVKPQVDGGKFRAIAVFQKGRNPLFPEVPSTVELGYGEPPPASYFIMAPKGLDAAIEKKLISAFKTAVESSEFKRFAESNGYLFDFKDPAQLTAELHHYRDEYIALLKVLGMQQKK